MKKLLLLFALLCVPAFAQVHSDIAAQNTSGNWLKAVPGALVYLCSVSTSNANCLAGSGLSTLFTDQTLSVGTTNPVTADSNGNYTLFAAPGFYLQCVKGGLTSFCQKIQIGGSGAVTCGAALNGSLAAYTSTTNLSCDPLMGTDFLGNGFAQSWRYLGPVNGFFTVIGGASDPGTNPAYKLGANSVRALAPLTVATSYYWRWPSTRCAVGQVWQVVSQSTDANGDPIDNYGCFTPGSGSGSVTSVGLALPSVFTVTGSPVTTTGTLTGTFNNAAADYLITGTAASTAAWKQINGGASCGDSTHAVSYDTATHTFGCQAINSGATLKTNGTNNASQTTLDNSNGIGVTVTDTGSGGKVTYGITGATQLATPSAPTLTVNGPTGSTTITYKVVAVEDPYSVYHTAASSSTSVSNANATLSSSNSITLSGYGDTLYGARCFNIYRTAAGGSPSTTGLIASCVGKIFKDTGLAGDSSTAPTTNNTVLLPHMASLPVANIPPNGVTGVDAPPASPTIFDDEGGETFGSPGGTNDGVYTLSANGTPTVSWSNGAISFTPDSGSFREYLINSTALPSAPYTFKAWVSLSVYGNSGEGDMCFLGLRESSTGKMAVIEIYRRGSVTDISANGGYMIINNNATSNTFSAGTGDVNYEAYQANSVYLQIQVSGGNVIRSWSPGNDGIGFAQASSQALTTPFTTAPNQLIFGGSGVGAGSSTCTFDYDRRTQ